MLFPRRYLDSSKINLLKVINSKQLIQDAVLLTRSRILGEMAQTGANLPFLQLKTEQNTANTNELTVKMRNDQLVA